jgi:hypothetical protein
MKRTLLAATLLSLGLPASASCTWEWLCNGEGTCKQMPICDSVYETAPDIPDMKVPNPPPLAMRPHAVSSSMSGLTCEHVMRKNHSGRWVWVEACYCTDATKTRDPSSPFANIVHCDTPWKE